MKIFAIHVENGCQSVLPSETLMEVNTLEFNKKPLLQGWKPCQYDFYESGERKSRKPDMSTVSGGALAIRSDLKERVFPKFNEDLEFLPIRVDSEDWYIVNCLRSTGAINEDESILYRSIGGQIFLVVRVMIEDSSLERSDFFVLDGSNRTTLLTLPSFVEHIANLGIRGITFREIGELNLHT